MNRSHLRMMLIALALLVTAADASRPSATDGTLTVRMTEAIAYKKGNDDIFNPGQDFYAINSIDYGPPHYTRVIDGRDYASFDPPELNVKVVPGMNQRFFDLYFELWDQDTCCFGNVDDGFDISPQDGPAGPPAPGGVFIPNTVTGSNPHVRYDVCTGQLSVDGVNGSSAIPIGSYHASLVGAPSTPGVPDNWGTLRFTVTPDPPNWLPDDIKVTDVQIVQTVYDQSQAVAGKETSLIVRVNSTYPFPITAPLNGSLWDSINTVYDSRTITIMPGDNQYALFDGTSAQPFLPSKPLGTTGMVHGHAEIPYQETVSPNAPPQLQDCANIDNIADATSLPIVRTTDRSTVYAPFDYTEDLNFISSAQLQGMYDREETFRLAAWPLASLDSIADFKEIDRDHGSNLLCPFEPVCTLLIYDVGASMANIDRLVLSVRKGWFADNAFRHQFIPSGGIGLSLGTFAPHAVLAEDGRFATAVHELGHTNGLSQHKCSNGGLLDLCYDEYNHPASDGSPYPARGFDVHGAVYPNGLHVDPNSWRPTLDCPSTTPVGRDVCAPNIMDSNSSTGYMNWIDNLTFDYLMDQLPHADPAVINVSGLIHLPDGAGDGTVPPAVEGMMPLFAYQHMGIEDMPEAPLSPAGEDFSGVGAFRIRFVTPAGVHDYRFNPRFFDNMPQPDLLAGFSLNLPWDPMTTAIQLMALSDLNDTTCQNKPCVGSEMLLAERTITLSPPSVSDVRAGWDVVPPPTPPGTAPPVPTIGPGHDAVIAWDSSDPDSSDLHALILVVRQGAAGGPSGPPAPMAIDVTGNSFTIPHDRLMDSPGNYLVSVAVSDGINTVQANPGPSGNPVFDICNLTNGGLEICDGIDDDCDGLVDNGSRPGGIDDVALNPQPLPPGGGPDTLMWNPEPVAQTYDVVYGDLGSLLSSGGDFGASILGCLADDTPGTSIPVGASASPAPGQAYFFLVRGENCIGPGTWNEVNPGPIGFDRDAGINGSGLSCPP